MSSDEGGLVSSRLHAFWHIVLVCMHCNTSCLVICFYVILGFMLSTPYTCLHAFDISYLVACSLTPYIWLHAFDTSYLVPCSLTPHTWLHAFDTSYLPTCLQHLIFGKGYTRGWCSCLLSKKVIKMKLQEYYY